MRTIINRHAMHAAVPVQFKLTSIVQLLHVYLRKERGWFYLGYVEA
jgi:hypothetical protein